MDLWDFEASLKLVPKTGSKATEKPCLGSKIKTKTQAKINQSWGLERWLRG